MLDVAVRTTTSPDTSMDRWRAVMTRDRSGDGTFVYAVRTTGVYCRPSCPSRRPRRENVAFYDTPLLAEAAGFRACRRCRPTSAPSQALDDTLERVRARIEQHPDHLFTLDELAAAAHVSPFHLQRSFRRRFGASPSAYARAVRAARFKGALRKGATVTDATYAAGFGSSRAAYEQAQRTLGMRPRAYQAGGRGEHIRFDVGTCRVGWVLVATTDIGVCGVHLGDDPASVEAMLRREYPKADIERAAPGSLPVLAEVCAAVDRGEPSSLVLDVPGSPFEHRVWDALRQIPAGVQRSYGDVAQAIGRPTAVRAVARACARNHVAVLIPCHRVVRADGSSGGYRWGVERKAALLAAEVHQPHVVSRASDRAAGEAKSD